MARRPREVIDLSGDDSIYVSDDDVVFLPTPPRNMKRRNNAERPIDIDDDEQMFQRFTPEENEWRRMLMMDHDVVGGEDRSKRKAERREGREGRPDAVASGYNQPQILTPEPLASAEPVRGGERSTAMSISPVKRPRVGGEVEIRRRDVIMEEAQPPADAPLAPSLDSLIGQILGILPDMCPEHASKEIQLLLATANALETVLAKAFEDGYPRTTKRAPEVGTEDLYAGKIYRAEKRRGLCYQSLSNAALEEAFPFVPVPYIRSVQNNQSFLFGPTYLQLVQDDLNPVKPFVNLKRPRPAGKGKTAMPEMDEGGVEFELEKNWILAHAAGLRIKRDAGIAKKLSDEAEWAAGGGVECGCCFGDYLPGDMFQCRDGHLFCQDCCVRHTETKLGDEVHIILCMDTSGCTSRFDERELARLLPPKSLDLLQRLRFAQELEDAAIEGLETCPSCPWAVVIDNPDEKLFRCMNEACGQISCRQCRNVEHLPKSCQEHADFNKADKRHAVEDAMSEALIRKCPKCQKPYIKDSGCNKIRCVKCKSISCYICQKLIDGYDHFSDHRPSNTNSKCRLWDRDEAQNDVANVVRARDAAVVAQRERAALEGVDIGADDLAVEAPLAPPRPPGYPAGLGHNPYGPLPARPPPNIIDMVGLDPVGPLAAHLPPPGPLDHQAQLAHIRQWREDRAMFPLAPYRPAPPPQPPVPLPDIDEVARERAQHRRAVRDMRFRVLELQVQNQEQQADELARRADIAEWALAAGPRAMGI